MNTADFTRRAAALVACNDATNWMQSYGNSVSREALKVVLVAFVALCVVAVVVAIA